MRRKKARALSRADKERARQDEARSQAALKGWESRRQRLRAEAAAARRLSKVRSAAALKGWESRRQQARAEAAAARRLSKVRSAAALKGWETRRGGAPAEPAAPPAPRPSEPWSPPEPPEWWTPPPVAEGASLAPLAPLSPLERALFELRDARREGLFRAPPDLLDAEHRMSQVWVPERIAAAKQAIKALREALYASRPGMINPLTGRATREARALFREAVENAGWDPDDGDWIYDFAEVSP